MSAPNPPHHDEPTLAGTVVVVTGGGALDRRGVASIADRSAAPLTDDRSGDGVRTAPTVIAADSGLDHARAAGLTPSLLVGDLDSISPAGRAWAEQATVVDAHDPDKSATDTELAIAVALDRNPAELVVLGGAGDRLDHLLATVGAITAAAVAAPTTVVRAWIGDTAIHVAVPGRSVELALAPGTTFSVVATATVAIGVTIDGARWPLTDATVRALSGLGVSNMAAADTVTVSVDGGCVAVLIPGVIR